MAKKKKGRLAKKKASNTNDSSSSGKPKIAKKKKQSILTKTAKKQEKLAVLKLTQAFAKSIQVTDDVTEPKDSFQMERKNIVERRNAQNNKKKKPKKKVTIESSASSGKTSLTFAPATFTLTKSTRQLLEETVQGLGGFEVSKERQRLPRPTYILPPPPNTPIVHKNPFAKLEEEEEIAEPPTLTFQPARFDASIDPDL